MISFKRSGHKAYVPTGYTGSNYYYYCYFYVTKFMLFYMYVCFFFYHGSMPCVSATIRDCLSLWDRWIFTGFNMGLGNETWVQPLFDGIYL